MKCVGICLSIAAFLLPGLAWAQDDSAPVVVPPLAAPSPQSGDAPKPVVRVPLFAASSVATAKRMPVEQREERAFLRNAAAASRFETEAARIAVGKSGNGTVRAFAATLIAHHTSAAAVLQHMLHARGMAQPMLENQQRKTLNRLAKLNGAALDREFMSQVGLKYQSEEVLMFERAQKVVKDPLLAGWIEKTLPTLKYHLASAEQAAHGGVKLVRGAVPARATRQLAAPAAQYMGPNAAHAQPVAARPSEAGSR
jgi:predicted outer membrane protein